MLRRLRNVRVLIVAVVVVVIVVIGYFWYRGSSLVKIRQVTVTGLSGPDVAQIRSALTEEALTMTTVNVSTAKLEQAVSGYPEVSSLSVTTQGSHAVTIAVVEKIPVAKLGKALIDGGGYVLSHDTVAAEALPQLKAVGASATYATTDGQVTGAGNLAVLTVLAAAPYKFLPHVQYATFSGGTDGVVLQLKNGPQLYFGTATEVAEKWTAALSALTSSDTHNACYVTVIDPQRPAAGINNERYCTGSATTTTSTITTPQTTAATTSTTSTTPAATATTPTTTAPATTPTIATSTSG